MSSDEVFAVAGLAVMVFWVLGAYNRLVRLRQGIAAAFAQVDGLFRQRHDLLAELVEATTVALADAPEVLAAVDAARRQTRVAADHAVQRWASKGRMASLALAEQVLGTAVARLVTLLKARPALRGDPQLRTLMETLSTTQHRLSAACHGFNTMVVGYNASVRQFPTRLVASVFGFRVAGQLVG